MKVRIVKTGEIKSANNSYALRMIEQGKAVAVLEGKKPAKKENPKGNDG